MKKLLLIFYISFLPICLFSQNQSSRLISYINQGDIAWEEGDYNLAVKHYSKCIEIDNSDSKLYLNRSLSYRKLYNDSHSDKEFLELALEDLIKADSLENVITTNFFESDTAQVGVTITFSYVHDIRYQLGITVLLLYSNPCQLIGLRKNSIMGNMTSIEEIGLDYLNYNCESQNTNQDE